MIGFFGGTFDPIHEGHIHLAKKVLSQYGFEKLYFVPAGQNPHKGKAPLAPAKVRLEMVKTAIAPLPSEKFSVVDWEIPQEGPSYTVLTLNRFIKQGNSAITIIMGDDVVRSFPRWFEPATILPLANCVVITRDANSKTQLSEILTEVGIKDGVEDKNRLLHTARTRWIESLEIEALPYASTRLREQIANQWKTGDMTQPPKGIEDSVWALIKKNHLYSESP